MEHMTWYEAKKYLTEYNRKYNVETKGRTEKTL